MGAGEGAIAGGGAAAAAAVAGAAAAAAHSSLVAARRFAAFAFRARRPFRFFAITKRDQPEAV